MPVTGRDGNPYYHDSTPEDIARFAEFNNNWKEHHELEVKEKEGEQLSTEDQNRKQELGEWLQAHQVDEVYHNWGVDNVWGKLSSILEQFARRVSCLFSGLEKSVSRRYLLRTEILYGKPGGVGFFYYKIILYIEKRGKLPLPNSNNKSRWKAAAGAWRFRSCEFVVLMDSREFRAILVWSTWAYTTLCEYGGVGKR